MRLAPYLCLNGSEIAHLKRVLAYGDCSFFDGDCPCIALDGDFDAPDTDPSPWYDAAYPESADFQGLLPSSITLSPPASREITSLREGSQIGSERLSGRVVEVQGWMLAQDTTSMWWGERWLTEALRDPCSDCGGGVLQVLPFCREEGDFDSGTNDFRTMVDAALVDGPRFAELSDDPGYFVQTVQFQVVTSMPWLYLPGDTCIEAEETGAGLSCALETGEWHTGTFVIELENTDSTSATDIVIEGKLSLDGSCPVTGDGDSVPASWTYTIPVLEPGDKLVIDGRRRKVSLYDASTKFATSGLSSVSFEGPWVYPDVGPCSTLCLSISSGYDAEATVTKYLREL